MFTDPHLFRPSRDAGRHLAFGYVRHDCLGEHLARLELRIGLSGLMRRFPRLRLAVPLEGIRLADGEYQLYEVHELPVAW